MTALLIYFSQIISSCTDHIFPLESLADIQALQLREKERHGGGGKREDRERE
jgi:hypothetical protein